MTKYRILASYITYCHLDVEAESLDEAKDIAYDADGGDFSTGEFGDWNIDDVIELKEEIES